MPKFATLDPKFSNISIVKNKVPWVDKLFQDIKNKLKKRGFWNSFILLCHLCSKLRKFQLFTKCKGRQRGRVTTYVSRSLLGVCYTCKINLGGLDFRFKLTEVFEHINGRENKKKWRRFISPFSRKVSLWIEISRSALRRHLKIAMPQISCLFTQQGQLNINRRWIWMQ